MLAKSVISLFIKGITLAGRFLFVIMLAKHLDVANYGIYGVVTITISFALCFIGMDFYIYTSREGLANLSKISTYIRDQFTFHVLMYFIFLPILYLLFYTNFLPTKYLIWFYIILVFEHILFEASRILIILSRPISANIINFFRSGFWAYYLVISIWQSGENIDLYDVWRLWFISLLLGIAYCIYLLRYVNVSKFFTYKIDWSWIYRGIVVATPFLVSTLAWRGIDFIDRYFIKYYWNDSLVGVYTFYSSISGVVLTIIVTGVVSIIYPDIMRYYSSGHINKYNAALSKLLRGIVTTAVFLCIFVGLTLQTLLDYIDRDIYTNYSNIIIILIIAVCINAISIVPHYSLLVRKKDKILLASSLTGFVVVVIMNFVTVPTYGIYGAAFSTLVGQSIILLLKYLFSLSCVREERNALVSDDSDRNK